MTILNKIIFVLKETFGGLIVNISKTVIQLFVCFISLVFFAVVFGIYTNVQNVATGMRDKIEISVFISDNASSNDIRAIESKIKNSSNIKSYEYISKDEAKTRGESTFEGSPEMLEVIQELENPFPSSFNIELTDAEYTEEIAKEFLEMSGVEKNGVKYGEEYMEKILTLSDGLKYSSYITLIFFFLIAVFFMMSIINIIISTKEEENKIMFMIGASPIQIKLPFYLQGIILGLVSSMLAYISFDAIYGFVREYLGFILNDISGVMGTLFMVMMLIGSLTGALATKIALRRFNKTNRNTIKQNK